MLYIDYDMIIFFILSYISPKSLFFSPRVVAVYQPESLTALKLIYSNFGFI